MVQIPDKYFKSDSGNEFAGKKDAMVWACSSFPTMMRTQMRLKRV